MIINGSEMLGILARSCESLAPFLPREHVAVAMIASYALTKMQDMWDIHGSEFEQDIAVLKTLLDRSGLDYKDDCNGRKNIEKEREFLLYRIIEVQDYLEKNNLFDDKLNKDIWSFLSRINKRETPGRRIW